jgi:hypothetical protein
MKKQTSGLRRNTVDKFYTKPEVVKICIEFLKSYLIVNKEDLIIEPSAGNGSFIPEIKKLSDRWIFYDIEPENFEIKKKDFLTLETDFTQKVHIVGNPPFGRQSSTAIKFIKKSCSFASSVSFILPKSFKKESLRKTFPLNFHLIKELDLPEKSFLMNGKEIDVPCVFQIWEKKDIFREDIKKILPVGFTFVEKENKPHVSVRRVGVNAGIVCEDTEDKSPQSHYFLKFTNEKLINQIIEKLTEVKFDFDNTVGPKSISKQELLLKYNPILIEIYVDDIR